MAEGVYQEDDRDVVMKCLKDCDTCIDDKCDGCPYGHDKAACEAAEITYFDAVEGQL
jgi:hypothetical protein